MAHQQHPIQLPHELVHEWEDEYHGHMPEWVLRHVATEAAQWGADQELEACCEWIKGRDWTWTTAQLRAARRPNPPSLKEQALAALERYEAEEWCEEMTFDSSVIRRALEQLDD